MDGLCASCSSLLLLGEGNFSFARSLSQKLSDESRNVNITATSFEIEEAVVKRNNGRQNIDALKQNGVTCLFGVDATKLHNNTLLEGKEFQGIIFNFPHIPGKANIAKNRDLLRSFFKSGAQKLSPAGEILLTLCNGQGGTPADDPQREPQNSWQIVAMATYGDLILTQTVPFRAGEYQEYDSTGYKGQDKGFLTEGAITHVFEKSPSLQDRLLLTETLSTIVDGQTVDFQCPGDLKIFMTRNLLSDLNHPLNLLKTRITSTIQMTFPQTKTLQEDEYAKVCHGNQNNCPGVYTLHKSLNIHEATILRPHLLCDLDTLIDSYANEGCVVAGKQFHRCVLSSTTFPITHQLLLTVPRDANDASWEKTVSKLLEGTGLHGNRSKLSFSRVDVKNGSLVGNASADSRNSLKRNHSESEHSCKMPSEVTEETSHLDQCVVCLQGRVSNMSIIKLTDSCGNQTTVGVCGKGASNNDIMLLFLDHLIMHLLHIDDIRLLWSTDMRLWEEFKRTHPLKEIDNPTGMFDSVPFQPRSRHPPLYIRDVSFWCPTEGEFDELKFMSVLRQASGFLIHRVTLRGVYRDEVKGDLSRCYRIEYLSCDQALSKEKLATIHPQVLELIRLELGLNAR
ncbi:ferredoxin-fold anticodon-binding domain-containing protein 1 homolog [Asterias rubens]|uniref:ferredoxin-fold anticodon-binding domain-containing protein 1 homolog n=1 Tax=Asterias rubens TaxID=7604 RepID=UPI0014553FCC|nr:ferredoxin-fold anticodon-binding domain-containing protein 1 homolog [Asterias rubens]